MLFDGFAPVASAPVKAIEQSGGSPDQSIRYHSVVEGNCVFNRKGGEQPETNEQSVAKANLILAKPVGERASKSRTPDLTR